MAKKKEITIEEIKQNIDKNKQLPKEYIDKINKKVFNNILIAIFVMLYFYFINLGSVNIETEKVALDLKVFSIITIIATVAIFEYAYKKDSGTIAIYGIETLFISLSTLFLVYFFTIYSRKFHFIVFLISLLFAIYYVLKAIIIYLKMKKQYTKSDISDIVKER